MVFVDRVEVELVLLDRSVGTVGVVDRLVLMSSDELDCMLQLKYLWHL